MRGPFDDLEKLLQLVADGESVDWDALEGAATDEESRAVLRQLRLVAEVSEVHRSQVDEVLPPDVVLTGPQGWSGGSWPPPRLPHIAEPALPDAGRWGKLSIVRKIGEGTYGEVFQAHDEWLDHHVALKLLKPEAESRVHPADLLHEARKLARVRHANVVSVHGADNHDGRVGFWMDFIDGETLAARVSKGRMSAGEATSVGQELCRALAAVHHAKIIHRDVKAQNVMRAHDGGRIILMDFGAGQFVDDPSFGQRAQGTPLYLAPELLTGEDASERSDIYAAGVLLYYLATGTFPVQAASTAALIEAHARGERRRLRDARPDLPDSFIAAVERAIDPDPRLRYPSAGEMEARLSDSSHAVPIPVLPADQGRPQGQTDHALRRRMLTVSGAIAGALLLLTVVGAITSRFYYVAFGIPAEVHAESPLAWPMWGLRSLLAPLILGGGGVAAVLGLMTVIYRLVLMNVPVLRGVVGPVAQRLGRAVAALRDGPTATTAALLFLTQVTLVTFTLWWFGQLIGAFDALIVQTSGGDLSPLSPANISVQQRFRQVCSLEFLAFTAAWAGLLRARFERREPGGHLSIAGGLAVTILSLILLVLPYRILSHNEHERVSYRSQTCYLLGVRAGNALLFCPTQEAPRNRTVALDDPELARGGPEENMFAPVGVIR